MQFKLQGKVECTWTHAFSLTDPDGETQRKPNPPHGSVRSLSPIRKEPHLKLWRAPGDTLSPRSAKLVGHLMLSKSRSRLWTTGPLGEKGISEHRKRK